MTTTTTTTSAYSPVSKPFALVAEFVTAADVMHAAEAVRDSGYRRWDVHTPFPIHGMDAAMGLNNSKVGFFSFFGGVIGLTTGMTMIWYMNKFDYPLIVGGKPLFSPLFAFPVSYELTILLASFGTLFGMFLLNKMPRWYNPLFKSKRFTAGATHDRYYIAIETSDPKYSETETRKLLESLGSKHIELVEE